MPCRVWSARTRQAHRARGSPAFKGVVNWGAVMRLSVSKCVVPPQPRRPGPGATVLCNYPIHRRRRRAIDAPPRGAGILRFLSARVTPGDGDGGGRYPRAADVLLRFRFVGREQARAAWNRTLRRRTATVRVASCEVVCRVVRADLGAQLIPRPDPLRPNPILESGYAPCWALFIS